MKKPDKSKKHSSPKNIVKKQGLAYDDFMTLFLISAFLIIDFFPYFKSYEIIAPQFLYLTVLNIFVGCYIYSNPVLHVTALTNIFKRSIVFKIYLAFIVLSGVSIFAAKNASLSLISIAEIVVVFTMFLNFTILLYNRLYLIYKIAFLIGISAFLQAGTALYNFDVIARTKSLSDALASNFLKGNTGNINILSASLMFKIPFIFMGIINYTHWKKWFLGVALTFATIIVLLINARASLLSFLLISIVFLVYYLKANPISKIGLKPLIYVFLPLIISFAIVNVVLKQSKLGGRYTSTTDRLKTLNTNDASVNRRLIIWKTAFEMVKKNPITGIGLGNFKVESIPYDLSTNATIPLHVHNDFLELTAETGILNGILYVGLFVLILFVNVKRLVKTRDVKIRNIALLTLLLLIVYSIDALFNFPFYRATMQLCFCLLLALTFVNVSFEAETVQLMNKKLVLILIALSAIPLYFTYNYYKTSNLEYLIQTDDINFESSGVLNGDEVINRQPKIPNVFHTSESFVEYAGIYYFREKKYEKAIQYLDSANKINPYLGRPNFYKSLIESEKGNLDSAYFYSKLAFYNRPINDNFYQTALNIASVKKDTAEILKMYHVFNSHIKKANNWEKAVGSLQAAGLSKSNLTKFINSGFNDFPKDSLVNQKINSMSITNYLIEGQALFYAGKHDEALLTYNKGLKLDPTNVYVLQNIGFYYYNLSKPSQAIPYLVRALKLPGLSDGKTEYFLGLCYLSIGDETNACKYFNVSNDKGYPDAKAKVGINCK